MATLFEPDYHCHLLPHELEKLMRPITGEPETWGGWQTFQKELIELVRPCGDCAGLLVLDDLKLQRVHQYATTNTGGFQDRFKGVLNAAIRAGWTAPLNKAVGS
jgi:hypothetical protein